MSSRWLDRLPVTTLQSLATITEYHNHMDPKQTVGQVRRKFLKTAGKFAVYTPPTVMMLMKPGYARMNRSMIERPYHRGNNGIGNGLDTERVGELVGWIAGIRCYELQIHDLHEAVSKMADLLTCTMLRRPQSSTAIGHL